MIHVASFCGERKVGDKPRFELRVTAASEIQNLAVTMARALEGGQGKRNAARPFKSS
jgi:hypothetical protein